MNNEKSHRRFWMEFSFHGPVFSEWATVFRPLHNRNINGLKHSEAFFVMDCGEGVLSTKVQYRLSWFSWWNNEAELDDFLKQPKHQLFTTKGCISG